MASQVNSSKRTKRTYTDPSQNLPNIEEKRALPKTLSEAIITGLTDTKTRERHYQKRKLEANFFGKYRYKNSR